MKKVTLLTIAIFLLFAVVSAQGPGVKNNPVGKWKFEAPYAPPEYSTGVIDVVLNEASYSATMIFTGIDFRLPGEKVTFENDILKFLIFVDGAEVNISLKFESESKMTGLAVHPEGEIPISMTRVPEEK